MVWEVFLLFFFNSICELNIIAAENLAKFKVVVKIFYKRGWGQIEETGKILS